MARPWTLAAGGVPQVRLPQGRARAIDGVETLADGTRFEGARARGRTRARRMKRSAAHGQSTGVHPAASRSPGGASRIKRLKTGRLPALVARWRRSRTRDKDGSDGTDHRRQGISEEVARGWPAKYQRSSATRARAGLAVGLVGENTARRRLCAQQAKQTSNRMKSSPTLADRAEVICYARAEAQRRSGLAWSDQLPLPKHRKPAVSRPSIPRGCRGFIR